MKCHFHVAPAELIDQFVKDLAKIRVTVDDFIQVVWKSKVAGRAEDSREFYQFINKPPLYYDSLRPSELDKFLCIQTWLCKPDLQKVREFNKMAVI